MPHARSQLRLALPLTLLALSHAPLPAQGVPRDDVADRIRQTRALRNTADQPSSTETLADPVFDLDFPGGKPAELVAALQTATGCPINLMIPDPLVDLRLPALRLHQITIPQLFQSLSAASKQTIYRGRNIGYYNIETEFFTQDKTPNTASVWIMRSNTPPIEPPTTRLFPLAYYLQHGLTVDDITTAIRTAWEMRGDAQLPVIKFHQETQLLIGVGHPDQLAIIGDILEALQTTVLVRREQIPAPTAAAPVAP